MTARHLKARKYNICNTRATVIHSGETVAVKEYGRKLLECGYGDIVHPFDHCVRLQRKYKLVGSGRGHVLRRFLFDFVTDDVCCGDP